MKDKIARADVNFFAMMNREAHKSYEISLTELRSDLDLLMAYLGLTIVEEHRKIEKRKKK